MTDREKFEAWFAPLRSDMQKNGLGGASIERRQELQWSAWQAAIASHNEPGDAWVEWDGGDCPLACSAVIEAKFRDGVTQTGERADVYLWYHDGTGDDLVAYRVVKA